MNKRSKTILWIVIAVVAVALLGILMTDVIGGVESKSFNVFMEMLQKGEITKLYVDGYVWTGKSATATYETIAPSIYNYTDLMALMQAIGADSANKLIIEYADPNAGSIWSSLLPFLGIAVLALIFWFMMRSASGAGQANMSIGKNKAQVQNNTKVRFSDVAGAEEEKEELQEVVEFLKAPKKFSSLGARIPSGVLLVGPPGTGKTLFAKAVAGEAGVPFFSVSGSDFVEMYVGVGAKRVRELFDMAKKSQPCIIFIDEIDAVGRRRGADR